MRPIVCALLLAHLALPVQPPARAQEPPAVSALETGPVRFRDQFILSLGFLAFEPASTEVLPSGEWRLDAVLTTANSWALSAPLELELDENGGREPITVGQLDRAAEASRDDGLVFADGEVSRTVLAVRRGFGRGVQVELLVPLLRLSGGSLDGGVESFHDSVGLEQAGRLGAPKDELFIFLDSRKGKFVERESSSLELGDVVLSAKYRLLDAQRAPLRLSIEAVVKLPTGGSEPLLSSGEVDGGAQILGSRAFGPWSVHGSLGLLRLGSSKRLGLGSQTLFSGLAAVERVIGRRTSLVLQGSVSESPFEDLATSRIGERSVQITGGIKRAVGAKNLLVAGVTENLENFNNSADINLHLGFSRTLN